MTEEYPFFPHDIVRDIQDALLNEITNTLNKNKNLVVHAPTGLGKTAASLAPALYEAMITNKTIFFLTSRNTQHKIAIDTLKQIKVKYDANFNVTDIIGKKWMCLQGGIHALTNGEFNEYCKQLREDKKCKYYERLKEKDKISGEANLTINELIRSGPKTSEEVVEISKKSELCPYEIAMLLAKESKVIIADYYYIFHQNVRKTFFKKNGKSLSDCIIIVDEAHNLPFRIKDLATKRLSTIVIKRSITESSKFHYEDISNTLRQILEQIEKLGEKIDDEEYINRENIIELISHITDYDLLIEDLHEAGKAIIEEQKYSSLVTIAEFLESWKEGDEGFTRIVQKKKGISTNIITISYRCMDPSIVSREVIDEAKSIIMMSGTLTPTTMYREIMGFSKDDFEVTLPSPFSEDNKLNLIIPKTSTKYTGRNDKQYEEIGKIVTDIINITPGNSIIFFPSYYLRDQVNRYLTRVEKTVFLEASEMTKSEREEVMNKFKSYKDKGATLLAVNSGSFAEGIDLPGDLLKTVVVVGLPLTKPDLETKALIDYYDKKFGKGWNYGYIYPAFNKVLQSAGRCIRSETDKGAIIFLDERYTWNNYYNCFPRQWRMKTSQDYKTEIGEFFKNNK